MEESNAPISMSEFLRYYRTQISKLSSELSLTLSSILSIRNSKIIKIEVVEEGTSISYTNERVEKNGIMDYEENVLLRIGYKEILTMYMQSNNNFFDSFSKLVTHEFLHVLFGDFKRSKIERCINFYKGNLLDDDKLRYSKYYDENSEDNLEFDHFIYNVAADFVINREIGIKSPFMRAENYDIDPDLTVFEYYSIVMKNKDLKSEIKKSSDMVSNIPLDFSEDNNSSDNPNKSSGLKNIPISDHKISRVTDEDLLETLFGGKDSGYGPSSIEFISRSLKKKDSIFINETKRFVRELKSDLSNIQDVGFEKEESWYKYNSRREHLLGDIILPGKIQVKDPFSYNVQRKSLPVLFIDVSASMLDILKELFYFCHHVLSYTNATLVFYSGKTEKVINSASNLNFDPSMFLGGGTNVKEAIREYKEKYNKNLNNVYILTDGYDLYRGIDVEFLSVFIFQKSGMRKLDIQR